MCQVQTGLSLLQMVDVKWWNAGAYYGVVLSEGLARRGHRVWVAGLPRSPVIREAQKRGLRTISLPFHNPLLGWEVIQGLRRLLCTEGIQLVNAHRSEGHFYSAISLRTLRRCIPLVRTIGDVRYPNTHPLNRWLHHRMTDGFIVSARRTKRVYHERLGLPLDRIRVVYAGLDIEKFREGIRPGRLRAELNLDPEVPLIGVIARLSPEKGHVYFLQAAAHVVRRVPAVHFLISGEEVQIRIAELQAVADRLGILQRVHWIDRRADVRDLISDVNIGVIPSLRSEVICRIAMEFMALGKPIVGTAVNVIPEMIEHGRTGLIVPPGDPEAMARAMVTLLREPEWARQLGENGRRHTKARFNLDQMVEQTENMYAQLLDTTSGKKG